MKIDIRGLNWVSIVDDAQVAHADDMVSNDGGFCSVNSTKAYRAQEQRNGIVLAPEILLLLFIGQRSPSFLFIFYFFLFLFHAFSPNCGHLIRLLF